MKTLHGYYFDGKTSNRQQAVCTVDDNGSIRIESEGGAQLLISQTDFSVSISPRLGSTARTMTFDNNSTFVTKDNNTVDQLEKLYRKRNFLSLVYLLENRKRYIFASLLFVAVVIFGSVIYGVPLTAKWIARSLPKSVVAYASEYTLRMLDEGFFEESKLDDDRLNHLLQYFQPVLDHHPDQSLKIIFKNSNLLGPNAFALPDGTIIMTDAMVDLAINDDELVSVLAHEIGHVVYRHGMRRVVQNSILGFLVMTLTGDISGATELFVGLPVLLTELSYSRDFELEADQYSLRYMRQYNIPPYHFPNIIRRISKARTGKENDSDKKLLSYLSTHPDLEKRLRAFE